MADLGVTTRVYFRDESGRFAEAVTRDAHEAVRETALDGARLAAVFAPQGLSGRLRAGIHAFFGRGTGGWATGPTSYALAQEEGARPHTIGADGQILANKAEGFGPVAGPVQHPGNPAVRFMRRAYEIVGPKLMQKIRRRRGAL